MADVFLSYSRKDQAAASALVDVMEKRGLTVWWDRTLEGGENWRKEIEGQIARSRVLVLLLSADSIGSGYVQGEWDLALQHGLQVMPVSLDGSRGFLGVNQIHVVELRDIAHRTGVDQIVDRVQAMMRRKRRIVAIGAAFAVVAAGIAIAYSAFQPSELNDAEKRIIDLFGEARTLAQDYGRIDKVPDSRASVNRHAIELAERFVSTPKDRLVTPPLALIRKEYAALAFIMAAETTQGDPKSRLRFATAAHQWSRAAQATLAEMASDPALEESEHVVRLLDGLERYCDRPRSRFIEMHALAILSEVSPAYVCTVKTMADELRLDKCLENEPPEHEATIQRALEEARTKC